MKYTYVYQIIKAFYSYRTSDNIISGGFLDDKRGGK